MQVDGRRHVVCIKGSLGGGHPSGLTSLLCSAVPGICLRGGRRDRSTLCARIVFRCADESGFFLCVTGQWLTYTLQPKLQPFMMATSLNHGYLRYTVNQTTLAAEVRDTLPTYASQLQHV